MVIVGVDLEKAHVWFPVSCRSLFDLSFSVWSSACLLCCYFNHVPSSFLLPLSTLGVYLGYVFIDPSFHWYLFGFEVGWVSFKIDSRSRCYSPLWPVSDTLPSRSALFPLLFVSFLAPVSSWCGPPGFRLVLCRLSRGSRVLKASDMESPFESPLPVDGEFLSDEVAMCRRYAGVVRRQRIDQPHFVDKVTSPRCREMVSP